MGRRTVQFLCCLPVLALLTGGVTSSAQAKSFFTPRRTFGVLFLGGSVFMAKKAIDFRRDANRIYDAYKQAQTAQEAERLFERSSDQDTKSQMSIGLSAVMLVSGLRLLLSSSVDDNIPKKDRRLTLDLKGDARSQAVRVEIKRRF